MKKKKEIVTSAVTQISMLPDESAFEEILQLINVAKQRAYRAVDAELVQLYWQVGEYISRKLDSATWGDGVVEELARFLARSQPGLRGFTRANLFRMRQFYQLYRENVIVAPLVRQLQPDAASIFKDVYTLEFLGLPAEHSEADLEGALLRNLGRFITELGRDFCFMGSQYPIQVGGQDFALDLLFFHRGMNCLVVIELKIREFRPEDLGKINFYLEALDRDVRKLHENPSVGLLLCATKDTEVVEYCLSRSLSPAMVAEYETMLPDKKLLKSKLHEFYQLCVPQAEDEIEPKSSKSARRKKKP